MRVFSGVSQIAVEYKIEDFCVEIFVSLPESYPLQAPVIEEGKRARVDAAQWRRWLLQLSVFVANQVATTSMYSHVCMYTVEPL